MGRVMVVCMAFALACTRRPPPRTPHVDYERPAEVETLAPPLTIGPFEPRAELYNAEPPPAPPDELASALFERLRATLHEDSVRDLRIDIAARALSKLEGDAAITRSAVAFALYEQGVPEPVIGIATARGDDVAALATDLARTLEPLRGYGPAAVGIGRVAGHGVVVVLTRAPMFRLHATPRLVAHGRSIDVAGTLEPGLRAPTLTVTHDDGPAERVPLAPIGTGYALRFTCLRAAGPRWLTIEALDGADVQQRLVFTEIDCDDARARTYRTEPASNLIDADRSRLLAALVNRERIAAGLPALRGDLRANAAAARRLAEGSSAATALREVGLLPLKQGAVVFHADSLEEAAELLLDEPRMRTLLLRKDLSHLGVATVVDQGGGVSVAVQLVEVSPAIDTRAITARLRASLQKRSHGNLEKIASWYATQLAIGWDPSVLADHLQRAIGVSGVGYVSVEVRTLEGIDDLDPEELAGGLVQPYFQPYYGLSVVQTARDGAFAGRIIVVALFGL